MGMGAMRIRGMKVIAMGVIEKRDGSEMVENGRVGRDMNWRDGDLGMTGLKGWELEGWKWGGSTI